MPAHERPINLNAQNPKPCYLFKIVVRKEIFEKCLSSLSLDQAARAMLGLLDVSMEDMLQFRRVIFEVDFFLMTLQGYPLIQFIFQFLQTGGDRYKAHIHW